jgi:hypothetical protein
MNQKRRINTGKLLDKGNISKSKNRRPNYSLSDGNLALAGLKKH